MAVDYEEIRRDNKGRYGTDIGRIGPLLLANRYADRTHFIYELLQNAEDALARRGPSWRKSREVKFELSEKLLRVSHFGAPFNERDVRGICGIAESPKELTDIGKFGIGFKSVYAFTDRPEVHSGPEDFVIENFVWPKAAEPIEKDTDETVFILPLRPEDSTAVEEITAGLQRLGPRVLLFLRAIEEISWSVQGGPSGQYLRGKPKPVGDNALRVELLWQEGHDGDTVDETWLVFARSVQTEEEQAAGHVEVAFRLDWQGDKETVRRVTDSPLVVFFPTVVETHLGFLVQGPYRTTPSRDNVPREDPWNKRLVVETGNLLVEALDALREMGLLDAEALRVLPLDRLKFSEGKMFAPLFETVRTALCNRPLLPCFNGGHVSASQAKLARTQELRDLFDSKQLASLFEDEGESLWLSENITQDRTPELRRYLMQELDVQEVTPEMILSRFDREFLEAQSDEWIVKLYEFLKGRPGLHRQLEDVSLIRLADGTHVKAKDANGRPQAFLPSGVKTGFPTVKPSVCKSEAAREFLESLGIREPDPVDDVIQNVLPKYHSEEVHISDEEYADDVRRFLTAYQTDSTSQRSKLTDALGQAHWIRAIDAGDGSKVMVKPGDVYLPTQRLKELFEGISGVLLVDDSYECLRGENIRDLLVACGAARYLRPVQVEPNFTWKELREMRRQAGLERCTWSHGPSDYALHGIEELLKAMPALEADARKQKGQLLWEALGELQNRRGTTVFSGTYSWGYSHESKSTTFNAAFVRRLNEAAWVPGTDGKLHPPKEVLFEETGWTQNPFLQSKINFKPPVVEKLAKEAGIEPGVITLLQKYGITSEEELKKRLGVDETSEEAEEGTKTSTVQEEVGKILRREYEPTTPSRTDTVGSGTTGTGTSETTTSVRDTGGETSGHGRGSTVVDSSRAGADKQPATTGSQQFISYVAVSPEDEEPDPDGLDNEQRLALEDKAIEFIRGQEPNLQRTPPNNPGFDLFEPGPDGQPIRWVEVKAMTGGLVDRPVGMTRAQFLEAQERGDRYWLYVVEQAGTDDARIVCIQDPAGKARTFTFDRGWLDVAQFKAPTSLAEPKEPTE